MRIVYLQQSPCVRTMKIARAVRKAKPEWEVALAWVNPPYEANRPFHREEHVHNDESFQRLCGEWKPDLVHVSNEPDDIATWVPHGLPFVHDVHDMSSERFGGDEDSEKRVYEKADAVVFCAQAFEEWASAKYEMKRTLVVHSAVSEDDFVESSLPYHLPSIVYEGGIAADGVGYPYRQYRRDFKELCDQGFRIGIYPMKAKDLDDYRHPNVSIFHPLPHGELLRQMSRYHYAYVGFSFHDTSEETQRYCDGCMPNKFFDAMAAGIPVIVRNCEAVAKTVQMLGIGLVWKGSKILGIAKGFHEDCVEAVRFHRRLFTMERQIEPLVRLYEEVVSESATAGS